MSIEDSEWDLQAAEYVLGALSEQNQKVYDALYLVDDDWKRRVHRWQARLDPLNSSTRPVQPPSYVLTQVMASINEQQSGKVLSAGKMGASEAGGAVLKSPKRASENSVAVNKRKPNGDEEELSRTAQALLHQWKESVRYWKFATILAIASVVGVLFLTPWYLSQRFQADGVVRTVAVLQSESDVPLWAVSYYPQYRVINSAANSTGFVSITAISDRQLSVQKSHQLWMVLPQAAGVRSVGLVPDRKGESVTLELPIMLDEASEFAVSLEPLGGAIGAAHGPIVARTLIIKVSGDLGS